MNMGPQPRLESGSLAISVAQVLDGSARPIKPERRYGHNSDYLKIYIPAAFLKIPKNTDFSAFVLSCKIIVKCSLILKFYAYSRFLVGQELDKEQKA